MYELRKLTECKLVTRIYRAVEYDPALRWIRLGRMPLPPGWNKRFGQLLLPIPDSFPEIPPARFFLDRDLVDRRGRRPSHYFLENEHDDLGWAYFCLHLEKGWRPTRRVEDGDNLLTIIERIQIGLASEV